MDFKKYQEESRKTAIYPDIGNNYVYPVIGLSGETGEVSEKFKKIIRDKKGKITDEDRVEIAKEIGDVLWYLTQICTELKISLNEVAQKNISKLQSRHLRGKLQGSGDNR